MPKNLGDLIWETDPGLPPEIINIVLNLYKSDKIIAFTYLTEKTNF